MHAAAYQWVAEHATADPVSVLDVGGRNINGSPRGLFPNATTYTVVDIQPGADVDVVADAATWRTDQVFDVVVCTEVFEHTAVWPQICTTARELLAPGGLFITTMAGPGRAVHSAVDGGPTLYPGEWYANVHPGDLAIALNQCGLISVRVDQSGTDVRATAHARRFHTGGIVPGVPGQERTWLLDAGETVSPAVR
jgi:hypothetical protein